VQEESSREGKEKAKKEGEEMAKEERRVKTMVAVTCHCQW